MNWKSPVDRRFDTCMGLDEEQFQRMQSRVRGVVVADLVYEATLDLVRGTRPEEGTMSAELKNMVQWGAGPRATISLLMAAKARALLNRRCHATTEDLIAVAQPVLRHRIILTFNAEAAGVDADAGLSRIMDETPSLKQAKSAAGQ